MKQIDSIDILRVDSSDILWIRNVMIGNGWMLCNSELKSETCTTHWNVYYVRKLINGIIKMVSVEALTHIFAESGKPGILMVAGQR